MREVASTNGDRTSKPPTRSRPWLWGYAVIVVLFLVSWIDQPVGPGRTPVGSQFASIGMFAIPAVLIVGALVAFVPQRMGRFRTLILAPIAFYVAAIASPFTVQSPASACDAGEPCNSSTGVRVVGFVDQSVIWAAGWVTEAVAIRIRRPRL